MKVFKFGGASVKDSEAVVNVKNILAHYPGEPLCIILSAMGKTTNALEEVADAWIRQDFSVVEKLAEIETFHNTIVGKLIKGRINPVKAIFDNIRMLLQSAPPDLADEAYDLIVSQGELLSTAIVSTYLNLEGIQNRLLDARRLVITNECFRNGRVNWEESGRKINRAFFDDEEESIPDLTIVQGFIGSSQSGRTVTLGREGSDFSAAVFAWALDAEEMIIWKDVPGVLNADPRYFSDTVKLEQISYRDAIELAYFGASVIHPKTIQPLQNKKIPLYVKSFSNPDQTGTLIGESDNSVSTIPSYIVKPNQVLVSISPKDFSFIAEDGLHTIFGLLAHIGISINLMQNSAISFSICIDNQPSKLHRFFTALSSDFRVKYNDNLELITIRYYDQKTIDKLTGGRSVLLEQKSRLTIQMVVGNEPAAKQPVIRESAGSEPQKTASPVKKRGRPPKNKG